MQIFKEDFETGTTTMGVWTSNGEVFINSTNPISGVYSAHLRANFVPLIATLARLGFSPATPLPQVIVEGLFKVVDFEIGSYFLQFFTAGSMLFSLGRGTGGASLSIYIGGLGYITVPLTTPIPFNTAFKAKAHVKIASGVGIADGEVTVWINDEVVYTNMAVDNSGYTQITSVVGGCVLGWGATSGIPYAEVMVDDFTVDDTLPPPVYHTLSIDTIQVTEVSFNLNGVTKTTPYSESLQEGTYTITMPAEVIVGTDTYRFVRWNDADTNPVKTVVLNTVISLVAEYELYTIPPPITHQLTVGSTPIQGIPFTIEKVS